VFRSGQRSDFAPGSCAGFADDTPETLHARIQVQEHRILPPAIALAAVLKLTARENEDSDANTNM